MYRDWVETALAQELGPVPAPADLWQRIQNPRTVSRRSVPSRTWNVAALAACAAMALVTMWLHPWRHEIRSSDSRQVRAWVRATSGVDVPLEAQLPAHLQLTGARFSKEQTEIDYRVRTHAARLTIGGRKTASNSTTFSWTMDGKVYTLACGDPEDLRLSCGLCHIG